jgi:Glycosyl hydrolase family 79 C-terminal beta domain
VALACLVIALAAPLLATGALDGHSDASPSVPRDAIAVDISSVPVGRPVPAGFIGFSLEYFSLFDYAGRDPAAINPTFIRLLMAVTPSGRPVLRFGGDSTDWTWWPASGAAKPGGVHYALTPAWAAVARATAQAANARLILGLNLEANSGLVAGTEARELLSRLGRPAVQAFELGNEPEVYGSIGWYNDAEGRPVTGRPLTYDFGWFLHDYTNVGSDVPTSVPLAGPASGAPAWVDGVRRFVAADPRTGLLTYHFYPLRRCQTPSSSPVSPSLGHLLSPQAATLPADIRDAAAVAHEHGLELRLDELNSVSCKGQSGISDTFASALWALAALHGMARAGVDGVNIHTLNDVPYEPFAFTDAGGRWQASVKPMYYGLLAFSRADPPGSRFLPTSLPRRVAGLRIWANRASDGSTRLVLINTSRHRGLVFAVRPPGSSGGNASLERLTAPGLTATSGVSLGGQSYGASTTTGELAGPLRTQTLRPVGQRYVVSLPAASAALVSWR